MQRNQKGKWQKRLPNIPISLKILSVYYIFPAASLPKTYLLPMWMTQAREKSLIHMWRDSLSKTKSYRLKELAYLKPFSFSLKASPSGGTECVEKQNSRQKLFFHFGTVLWIFWNNSAGAYIKLPSQMCSHPVHASFPLPGLVSQTWTDKGARDK